VAEVGPIKKAAYLQRFSELALWHGYRSRSIDTRGRRTTAQLKEIPDMKRTLSVLSAALFATALSAPAFAADMPSADASPAAMASPATSESSTSTTTATDSSSSTTAAAPKHHRRHHHKKSTTTTESSTDSSAPAAAASPASTEPTTKP